MEGEKRKGRFQFSLTRNRPRLHTAEEADTPTAEIRLAALQRRQRLVTRVLRHVRVVVELCLRNGKQQVVRIRLTGHLLHHG